MKKTILKYLAALLAAALLYNAGHDVSTYVLSRQVGETVRAEMEKAAKEHDVANPYIKVHGCFWSTDTWWCDVQAGLDEENSTRFSVPVE